MDMRFSQDFVVMRENEQAGSHWKLNPKLLG